MCWLKTFLQIDLLENSLTKHLNKATLENSFVGYKVYPCVGFFTIWGNFFFQNYQIETIFELILI